MVEAAASCDFTKLDTDETTTTAKASVTVGRQVYYGVWKIGLNTDRIVEIARRQSFDQVGYGLMSNVEDFIAAAWEATGISPEQHIELGIYDTVEGAVIDVSNGGREIVRSIAVRYSFAIFERAAKSSASGLERIDPAKDNVSADRSGPAAG